MTKTRSRHTLRRARYHAEPKTKQVGFAASYFDSSDGACVADCGGHGSCRDGLCACSGDWGADGYGDCSTPVRTLVDSTYLAIDALPVGGWAYFKLVIDAPSHFLVELIDGSTAGADPRLVLSVDTLPTLSHSRYSDWFNWFYDCSDIHYMQGDAEAGTYYVGVTNDLMRAEAGEVLTAKITVRLSDIRRAVNPFHAEETEL